MNRLLGKVLIRLTIKRMLDDIPVSLDVPGTGCPWRADLAAYLDRRLRGGELRIMEEHLAYCAECRAAVIELREVQGSDPPRAPVEVIQAAKDIISQQCAREIRAW